MSLQKGDSAVVIATVKLASSALCKLVTGGADLNLQNDVCICMYMTEHAVTVTAPYVLIRRVSQL